MTIGLRPRLILASASPRRRQLLADAGFEFDVVAPEVNEVSFTNLTLREVTSWNALRKGLAVARAHPDAVVLAADTLVALGHQVLGKPADRIEAARTLRLLSGQAHEVASGIFIAHLRRGRSETFCVTSQVVFQTLSDQVIEDYLTRIDPLDKAGAYAAQGVGGTIIARVVGSRSNVIGLPVERTRSALARFGIRRARRPRPDA
jgi:septum formation protein